MQEYLDGTAPAFLRSLIRENWGRGGRFGDEGLWVRFLPFFDEFLDALTEEHKLDIMVRQQECYFRKSDRNTVSHRLVMVNEVCTYNGR